MYEYIRGTVTERSPTHAVIETASGVAYWLAISLQTYSSIPEQGETKLFTHFIVREDTQQLYGFAMAAERELFRKLIGVSGVGGNTARMILSTFRPEELVSVIGTGKAEVLKSVKGLGIKTAQKIIVELRDKVVGIGSGVEEPTGGTAGVSSAVEEALAAMTMLGFPKAAADKVIRNIVAETGDLPVEDIIRIALKKM